MFILACTPPSKPVDPAYRAEIEAFAAKRLQHLTADDGWLTLVGLHWLRVGEGPWRVGVGANHSISLPAGHAPDEFGELSLNHGTVQFVAAPNSGVTANGRPLAAGPRVLASDNPGPPTLLEAGSVAMHVISRGDALALRVRDRQAPTRQSFQGIAAFPIDPAWRIEATFEPAVPPRELTVPTVVGTMEKQVCPGSVSFSVDGKAARLDVVQEPDSPQLFIVFADKSNGKDTYGTGRFLYADQPRNGKVIVDFNRAYNPPCAFTPFATCPLPPPQNRLGFAVLAGERRYH